MRITSYIIISLLLIGKLNAQVLTGIYAPSAGQNGSTAIHKDSSIIVGWANSSIIERGWQDIANTALGKTTTGNDTSATEKSGVHGVVSLGDGGTATLTFNGKITNGPGADFVVFENSFDGLFLELAFVEVSSDGINFFRFDPVSLTDTTVQLGTFGNLDATNIYNLAGKYKAGFGTPFDLNELAGISGLDINNITHIKIIDVVGSINEGFATYDASGRAINDPYPTAFATGGFDLDAIGVINFLPTSVNEISKHKIAHLYPIPTNNSLNIDLINKEKTSYQVINLSGQIVKEGVLINTYNSIAINDLKNGVYFLKLLTEKSFSITKIIKQ